MFAKTELESMKYHDIVNLARSNNLVFKSRKKKAYLINRLLSLWSVQEDDEYLSASENSDKSVMFKSFESVDRRETFTISSPAPNISLVGNFKYQDPNFANSDGWSGRLRSGKPSILPRSPPYSLVESSKETENQPKKNSSSANRRETFDIVPNKYNPNNTSAAKVDSSFKVDNRRETFEFIPDEYDANINSVANVDDSSFKIDNRRETFDIIPDKFDANITSVANVDDSSYKIYNRRETFDIIPDKYDANINTVANVDESSFKIDNRRETFDIIPDSDKENTREEPEKPERTPGKLTRQLTFELIDTDKMGLSKKSVDVSVLTSLAVPSPRVPCSPFIERLSTPKRIASPARQLSGKLLPTRISSPRTTRFPTPKRMIVNPLVLASAQLPPRSARTVAIRTAHSEKMLKSGKSRMQISAMKRSALDSSKKNILAIAKGGKVGKKSTPLKLPNFNKLHTQLFKNMESIVDYAERRAKSRIPVKSVNPSLDVNIMPGPSTSKLNKKDQLTELVLSADKSSTYGTMKVGGRKKGVVQALPQKTQVVKKVNKPPTAEGRTGGVKRPGSATKPNKALATDMVTKKVPSFSAEKNREKERSLHQLVRTNKRFELQMNVMRKAKF